MGVFITPRLADVYVSSHRSSYANMPLFPLSFFTLKAIPYLFTKMQNANYSFKGEINQVKSKNVKIRRFIWFNLKNI